MQKYSIEIEFKSGDSFQKDPIENQDKDSKISYINSKFKKFVAIDCALDSEKLENLLQRLNLKNIKKLNLHFNTNIAKTGFTILNKNLMIPSSPNIKQINLGFCGLTDLKLNNLFYKTNLKSLKKLNFYFNPSISPKGWTILRNSCINDSIYTLVDLCLEKCGIDDKKLNILFEGVEFKYLKILNLAQNNDITEYTKIQLKNKLIISNDTKIII